MDRFALASQFRDVTMSGLSPHKANDQIRSAAARRFHVFARNRQIAFP
jgi:hypothetical protein